MPKDDYEARRDAQEQERIAQENLAKEMAYNLGELLSGRSYLIVVPHQDKNGNIYGQRVQVIHPHEF